MTAFCHADGPPVNAVSFAARKLYGEIQFRARNEHGCTRCYVATLAAKFDVSRRWVHALLNQLEEAGWIQRYTEPGQRTYIRPVVDAVASDVVPAPPARAFSAPAVVKSPARSQPCSQVRSQTSSHASYRKSENSLEPRELQTPPAEPNERTAEPSPAVLAAVSSLREGIGGEIPEAVAQHEVQTNRLTLSDVCAIVAAYQERRASVRNVVGWVRDACRKRYKPGEGPGVRLPANHPANRDSAASVAAASKARTVTVIVPPVRSDLAGLTPRERLAALKSARL